MNPSASMPALERRRSGLSPPGVKGKRTPSPGPSRAAQSSPWKEKRAGSDVAAAMASVKQVMKAKGAGKVSEHQGFPARNGMVQDFHLGLEHMESRESDRSSGQQHWQIRAEEALHAAMHRGDVKALRVAIRDALSADVDPCLVSEAQAVLKLENWLQKALAAGDLNEARNAVAEIERGKVLARFPGEPPFVLHQSLQYFSEKRGSWVDCHVTETSADGSILISLKKKANHWYNIDEQILKFRAIDVEFARAASKVKLSKAHSLLAKASALETAILSKDLDILYAAVAEARRLKALQSLVDRAEACINDCLQNVTRVRIAGVEEREAVRVWRKVQAKVQSALRNETDRVRMEADDKGWGTLEKDLVLERLANLEKALRSTDLGIMELAANDLLDGAWDIPASLLEEMVDALDFLKGTMGRSMNKGEHVVTNDMIKRRMSDVLEEVFSDESEHGGDEELEPTDIGRAPSIEVIDPQTHVMRQCSLQLQAALEECNRILRCRYAGEAVPEARVQDVCKYQQLNDSATIEIRQQLERHREHLSREYQNRVKRMSDVIGLKSRDACGCVVPGKTHCVGSFPGQCTKHWKELAHLSDEGLCSIACSFLDEAWFGLHTYPSHMHGRCLCHKLYGEQTEHGCYWWTRWLGKIEAVVEDQQTLVVFYSDGFLEENVVEWDNLPRDKKQCVGLGVSQQAELAYIRSMGWKYELRHVSTWAEYAATDGVAIKLNISGMQVSPSEVLSLQHEACEAMQSQLGLSEEHLASFSVAVKLCDDRTLIEIRPYVDGMHDFASVGSMRRLIDLLNSTPFALRGVQVSLHCRMASSTTALEHRLNDALLWHRIFVLASETCPEVKEWLHSQSDGSGLSGQQNVDNNDYSLLDRYDSCGESTGACILEDLRGKGMVKSVDALQQAVLSRDDSALEDAIQVAKREGIPSSIVEKALQELRERQSPRQQPVEVPVNQEVVDSVLQAIEQENVEELERTIQDAASQGVPEEVLLNARRVVRKKHAYVAVQDSLNSDNVESIAEAIRLAQDEGVSETELEVFQKKLDEKREAQLEQKRRDLLARLQEFAASTDISAMRAIIVEGEALGLQDELSCVHKALEDELGRRMTKALEKRAKQEKLAGEFTSAKEAGDFGGGVLVAQWRAAVAAVSKAFVFVEEDDETE
eukprot:TRINITY_DN22813_c0_g2_i1.p1 TRINITY_DN22813_c0_g2~~TRINITY_DN22813_c0_g2_i1.p1  ORF type:complete len:1162 (+),score=173.59 TRINITY_DN22813_c0_g2_i1:53-3538(+)